MHIGILLLYKNTLYIIDTIYTLYTLNTVLIIDYTVVVEILYSVKWHIGRIWYLDSERLIRTITTR